MNLTYGYDPVGNILAITDTVNSNQKQTFTYDALDRLVTASTNAIGNGQYNQSYTYDAIGNLTSNSRLGDTYWYESDVTGCVAGTPARKPHAVTAVTQSSWEMAGALYDCNGNMTSRTEGNMAYQQGWDAENRLAVVTNTATSPNRISRFVYDGDGARVMQIQISGTQVITTAYAGSIEVQITATQRITKSYYSAGAQLIAMRVYTSSSNSLLYFLHSDHLGSASLTTNASGGFVARQLYDAWGNVRYLSGSMPTDIAFTGQRSNSYINLVQMGARWYDPEMGRWLSPDTIVPDPQNPQSLNRFSYVNNRPLNIADPSGHCPKDDKSCEAIVKSIKDIFGVILQDDTAIWQGWEARWVEDALKDISAAFGVINGLNRQQSDALVKSVWGGVTMYRMHRTNAPFNNLALTPPGHDGKRIEIPDASSDNVWWTDERKTKNTIAEELAHSWDFEGALLGGWDGGHLSQGLLPAIGTDAGGCFTYLICGWDDYNTGYNPGREKTVSKHAAYSPVEDWAGSFAQLVEPRPDFDPVSSLRAQYIGAQIALLVRLQ